jgi:hypothetical protein
MTYRTTIKDLNERLVKLIETCTNLRAQNELLRVRNFELRQDLRKIRAKKVRRKKTVKSDQKS